MWRVHAYVVMRNHYHLALETPRGNLVEGMQWLQATFANRFNRLRQENGHVFQGRYQALLVEDLAGLGAVGHYIHLNAVRARLLPIEKLAVAAHLKQHSTVTNPWLAQVLQRGAPEGVSRYVAELKLGRRAPAATLKSQISNIMV